MRNLIDDPDPIVYDYTLSVSQVAQLLPWADSPVTVSPEYDYFLQVSTDR